MLEKILGKKKSIQRSLTKDMFISAIIVFFLSIVGFYLFVHSDTTEKLIQINIGNGQEIKDVLQIIQRCIFILFCNSIIISFVFIKIASKKMLQPIEKLTEATKKVASGDFDVKLETKRQDEIAELTNNFNEMVKDLGSIECLQKEFIDNVSHELKTPISSIQGFAELLEDDTLSKEERIEYGEIIKEETNRLLNISTNMLKLSKLQNQNKITQKEEIDVAEQIRKAISLLEPKWTEKEITFNISMEEKYFYGDEELIFQIWVNLIDNAIKFSKQKGKINITLKEKKKENVLEVKIKDNGIGMSEEEKEKIFTRFYQIDKSHSKSGSGLGLAIVKRIVELSNGKIDVKSKENDGTTMIVKLPLEKKTTDNILIK